MHKLLSPRLRAPLVALILFALFVTVASAHPLGNFTINHYARLEVASGQIRVRYVLDYAEIPTFQEKQTMDADGSGTISERESATFLAARIPQYLQNLKLTINGQAVALQPEQDSAHLRFLPGQGGLEIMQVTMWLDALYKPSAIGSGSGDSVEFRDENYSERLGWREIVVPPAKDFTIQNSNVPAQDTSSELTAYPQDLLTNPRNDRVAKFNLVPGPGSQVPSNASRVASTSPLAALDRTREDFGRLLTSNQELTPLVLLISFFAAMALGALHAFSPGHGKAVVGAYLVGSRGNWQHAVFLGLVVTITHTAGVYALGFVTLFLSAYVLPEQLFPWLGFISGALVALIGVQLFVQRFRAARTKTTSYDKAIRHVHSHDNAHSDEHFHSHEPEHQHALAHAFSNGHAHDHPHGIETEHELAHAHELVHVHTHADGANHSHTHTEEPQFAREHRHADGNTHSHSHDFATPEQEAEHMRAHLAEIEAFEKPSWKNLLSLGVSGGLLPCPSALVVMLSAIALGRVLYGFYLIIAFSLGLASVLVITGLALLYAGKYAGRVFGGKRVGAFVRYVPIVGAFFVALLGVGIALDAFFQTGLVP